MSRNLQAIARANELLQELVSDPQGTAELLALEPALTARLRACLNKPGATERQAAAANTYGASLPRERLLEELERLREANAKLLTENRELKHNLQVSRAKITDYRIRATEAEGHMHSADQNVHRYKMLMRHKTSSKSQQCIGGIHRVVEFRLPESEQLGLEDLLDELIAKEWPEASPPATIQEVALVVLNRAMESDPRAIRDLLSHYVPCNSALAEDANIICRQVTESDGSRTDICFLGLLNGMLSEAGLPAVAAAYRDGLLVRFVPYQDTQKIKQDHG